MSLMQKPLNAENAERAEQLNWLFRTYRENPYPYTEHTELAETHGRGILSNDFSVLLRVFRVFRVRNLQRSYP